MRLIFGDESGAAAERKPGCGPDGSLFAGIAAPFP
jgi:hypothetical protein